MTELIPEEGIMPLKKARIYISTPHMRLILEDFGILNLIFEKGKISLQPAKALGAGYHINISGEY